MEVKRIKILFQFLVNSLNGDQGNQWRMGTVCVNMSGEFYFIIEGTHGGGHLGYIAIDDLSVISNLTYQILTTTTIVPTTASTTMMPLTTSQRDPSTSTLFTGEQYQNINQSTTNSCMKALFY
jgi:hypothetical protein